MKLRYLLSACASLLICSTANFAAPIVVQIPNQVVAGSATSATAGFFDLPITNPSPTESIAGYTITFIVTPTVGTVGTLTFTGSAQPPNPLLTGTTPSSGTSGGKFFTTEALASGSATATSGKNLFEADYSVGAGTVGSFVISFDRTTTDPLESKLQDSSNNEVTATYVSGTINVVVPEPMTCSVLFCGGGLALLRRRRRS